MVIAAETANQGRQDGRQKATPVHFGCKGYLASEATYGQAVFGIWKVKSIVFRILCPFSGRAAGVGVIWESVLRNTKTPSVRILS